MNDHVVRRTSGILIFRLASAGLVFALTACAASNSLPAAPETVAIESAPELPLALEDETATNDGERLHVAASVSARADWDVSKVVLVLRGIARGQTIAEKAERLSDHVARITEEAVFPALPAGEKISLSLSIPVAQVEEYQLELLWGEDAEPWLKEKQPGALTPSHVAVTAVRLECRDENCDGGYYIYATLRNGGGVPLERLLLRVGFILEEAPEKAGKVDLSAQPLENEREIRVYPLSIQPGKSQAIRLVFNAPFTKAEGAEYHPVVRVIAVN